MQGFTLRSGEILPIYWIPSDPADVNVYYPKSVIINAQTGILIASVNLEKQANNSYTGSFLVPQDGSNLGMYIIETLSVYTDISQTIYSTDYAIEQRTHKIKNETQNYGGASIGGDKTDYNYIEKLVKRIVEDAVKTIKFEQKETDLSPVLENLKNIKNKQNKYEKMLGELSEVVKNVENKEIQFPQGECHDSLVNLGDMIDNLRGFIDEKHTSIGSMVKNHLEGTTEENNGYRKEHFNSILEKLDKHSKDITRELEYRFENVDHVAYQRDFKPERKEREEEKKESIYLKGLV